jgi:hypothetical protein
LDVELTIVLAPYRSEVVIVNRSPWNHGIVGDPYRWSLATPKPAAGQAAAV